MKTLFATLIAAISFTMVSCSSNDLEETQPVSTQSEYGTKSVPSLTDSASVCLGTYNAVQGYNIKVQNVRIEGHRSSAKSASSVSNAYAPNYNTQAVYDQVTGNYNAKFPTYLGASIAVHFDVVMSDKYATGEEITVTDVTYSITCDGTEWMPGARYDYLIKVTPELLGLVTI